MCTGAWEEEACLDFLQEGAVGHEAVARSDHQAVEALPKGRVGRASLDSDLQGGRAWLFALGGIGQDRQLRRLQLPSLPFLRKKL